MFLKVDQGCADEFTYLIKLDFMVLDGVGAQVGTGSAERDHFFIKCEGSKDDYETLEFVTRVGTTTIVGEVKLGPILCV